MLIAEGDLQGALADYDKALSLADGLAMPDKWVIYLNRCVRTCVCPRRILLSDPTLSHVRGILNLFFIRPSRAACTSANSRFEKKKVANESLVRRMSFRCSCCQIWNSILAEVCLDFGATWFRTASQTSVAPCGGAFIRTPHMQWGSFLLSRAFAQIRSLFGNRQGLQLVEHGWICSRVYLPLVSSVLSRTRKRGANL